MDSIIFTYKKHHLCLDMVEEDDVRKGDYTVKLPDGTTRPVPWSPYEMMHPEEFRLWVDLGMPSMEGGNLRPSNLIALFYKAPYAVQFRVLQGAVRHD